MYKTYFKRLFDLFVSLSLLIILFPLFLIIGIIVWIETKKFPVFKQLRGLSLNNQVFYIYKFRTLVESNSSSVKLNSNNSLKREHLSTHLTLSGKILRKTGLDELPQLINIIKGEMSLIGPRPLILEDLHIIKNSFPKVYEHRDSMKIKPGITGLWQINRDKDFSIHILHYWDSYYSNNITFLNDIKILFDTIYVILLSKHKDAILPEQKIRLSLSLTIIFLYTFFYTITISFLF
ncbi:MAG: sugar transferase [Ignavibacterium sp.]|nr:sugar transferase [Ignavibacterium sp.]MDW8375147.1 sugar transferase [Ignavibacteriales bacterium]